MRRCIALLMAIGLLSSAALLADEPVKLLEPQPLTKDHQVVTLFPPGNAALKSLAGFDQQEKFNGNGRVNSVTNIHNPSIELYLADPEKANGASVIIAAGGGNNTLNVGPGKR